MRKFFFMFVLLVGMMAVVSCGNKETAKEEPAQAENAAVDTAVTAELDAVKEMIAKRDVLEDPAEKEKITNEMAYALQSILSKAPENAEANAMMDDVQMDLARVWLKRGGYSKAKEIMSSVLQFSPDNEKAKELMAKIEDWEILTKEEFSQLKKNMYMDEVEQLIGYPLKKQEKKDKYGQTVYGWFYKEEGQKAVPIWFNANGQIYSLKWPK